MSNPETIEIHGLETIHKLCKFGADNNMEGCTFTEIVERLFAELEKAKAQAVPEGFVLIHSDPLMVIIDCAEQYIHDRCDRDEAKVLFGYIETLQNDINKSESGAEG